MSKPRNISIKDSGPYFAIQGNLGILKNHIHYFAKKAEQEVAEIPNDYASCPNYAAWLRFQTELITNLIFWQYFRHTGNDWNKISGWSYKGLIKEIKKSLKKEISDASKRDKLIYDIKLVIELRHCFVHGGLPNILREGKMDEDVKPEEIESLITPANFQETKEFFHGLYQKIKKHFPMPTIVIRSVG